MFLDGDTKWPTLVGTGTEDYIGTGWGQGEYHNNYQGSLASDNKNDIYAFYRYHIPDPVYFHNDCRVTIQQIGSASISKIKDMIAKGGKLKPVWVLKKGGNDDIFNLKGKAPEQILLLDRKDISGINDPQITEVGSFSCNFYRSDDVSATAYFYLDKPSSNLLDLPAVELRGKDLKEKVWPRIRRK
jgi:hypothetical protein